MRKGWADVFTQVDRKINGKRVSLSGTHARGEAKIKKN